MCVGVCAAGGVRGGVGRRVGGADSPSSAWAWTHSARGGTASASNALTASRNWGATLSCLKIR